MAKIILTLVVYVMFAVLFVAFIFACEAAIQYVKDIPMIRRVLCRRARTC